MRSLVSISVLFFLLGCKSKYPERILSNYYIDVSASYGDLIINDGISGVKVPGNVVEVVKIEKKIMVKQKPRYVVKECVEKGFKIKDCKKAYHISDIFFYWIIDTESNLMQGPLKTCHLSDALCNKEKYIHKNQFRYLKQARPLDCN